MEIVVVFEFGLDCEEEGWDDNEVEDEDEVKVICLFECVFVLWVNMIVLGWFAFRDSRRSGVFMYLCCFVIFF